MKILSIVVTHNALRNNWLYKCLDSLLKSEQKTDIIVIDNRSTDDTCTIIKDKYPEVILIENGENRGFGQANNQGFEYGVKHKYDYYFLLNQDAWIQCDTLSKLVAVSIENSDFGIISPLHLDGTGLNLDRGFSLQISAINSFEMFSDFMLKKSISKLYETKFVCAASWLVTSDCVKKVGGFSPVFFHYAEDENYYHRLVYKNRKIGVAPNSFIFHDRENRKKNKFFEGLELEERLLLMNLSNPISSETTAIEIKKNQLLLISAIIMRDLKKVKKCIHIHNFLKKNNALIESCRKKSMSDTNYIFLNTDYENSCFIS